jgi:hypothetical protein
MNAFAETKRPPLRQLADIGGGILIDGNLETKNFRKPNFQIIGL